MVYARVVRVAAVAVSVMPLLAGSSAVAAMKPNPAGERRAQATLVNPKVMMFSGHRTDDGDCVTDLALTIQPGSPAGGAVEVASDEATCAKSFKVGNVTATQARQQSPAASGTPTMVQGAVGQFDRTTVGSAPQTANGATAKRRRAVRHASSTGVRATAAYSRKRAYFRTDIVGRYYTGDRVLAFNYNAVDWAYGNGCVHNPVYYGNSQNSYEGFVLDGFNLATGASCSFAYSSTYSHYIKSNNSLGCSSGGTARMRFDRNSIHGNSNGSFSIYNGAAWCVNDLNPYAALGWSYY